MMDSKPGHEKRTNFLERIDPGSKALILVIAGLVSLVYGNTLFNGYSVDDNLIVDGNAQVEMGFSGVKDIFLTNYLIRGDKRGSYRALPRATYAIENGFFGINPHISHGINIILFFLSCWLVLLFLYRLFPEGKNLAIVLSVLIFTVHPIHTEVVASLKNRDELLQLLFSLSSCIFLISYARKGNLVNLFGAIALFLSALMSKETAVQFLAVFPVVFFYADRVNIRRVTVAAVAYLSVVMAFASFMIFYLNPDAVLWMHSALAEFSFIEHPLMHTEDKSVVYGTGFYGLAYYLRLFVFPYPLGFFYGFDQFPLVALTDPRAILSILLLVALGIAGFREMKKRSMLGLGIFIMLICLSIFSNLIIQVSGIIAERFAYSSSLGYCIIAGFSIQYFMQRFGRLKNVIAGISIIVLAVMGMASAERNSHWESYLSLAEHDAKTFEKSAIIHLYLALHLHNTVLDTAVVNRYEWADKLANAYGRVARIHPDSKPGCRYVILKQNSFTGPDPNLFAYHVLFKAGLEEHEPNDYLAYSNLLVKKDDRQGASTVYESWVERHPNDTLAYQKAAENLLVLNRQKDLIKLVIKMESEIPDSELPLIYRGNLAMMSGNTGSALGWFEKALRKNPRNTELYEFLCSQYVELKMTGKTVELNALIKKAKGQVE